MCRLLMGGDSTQPSGVDAECFDPEHVAGLAMSAFIKARGQILLSSLLV